MFFLFFVKIPHLGAQVRDFPLPPLFFPVISFMMEKPCSFQKGRGSMFTFGFSYIGLLYLILLFVPNALWTKNKPEGYEQYAEKENRILLAFERVGEVLVCVCALIFSDLNIRNTCWIGFLIASFVCMVLYEIFWIRYFKSQKTMRDFYSGLLCIPVAGATLPVLAFFLLGIYGGNAFLLVSVLILGIGHIGIHLGHRNAVCGKPKRKLVVRVLQWIFSGIGILLIAALLFVFGSRNLNYAKHYRMAVDEGIFVPLGGQEQYLLIRGMDAKNPVIIYLHGGPASPDTYVTYGFTDHLIDEYTVVAWDQRGCGRTYFRSGDPKNETASFAQAQKDLDELVEYVKARFGQEQVIILGHSYGTILGSVYVREHPEKVSAYIGAAQVVSLEKMDLYSYEDALARAKKAGDDTAALEKAYDAFRADGSITHMMELRHLTAKYHPAAVADKSTMLAIRSPYFGLEDFRWFLKQLGDIERYWDLNEQLFRYTFTFDAYDAGLEYGVPVCFISGSCDWICPVDSIREYAKDIVAEKIRFETIEGCGHGLQYSSPEEFARKVKAVLGEAQITETRTMVRTNDSATG